MKNQEIYCDKALGVLFGLSGPMLKILNGNSK